MRGDGRRTNDRVPHDEGPDRTRVVLIDGPNSEMMAPNAEAGRTQQKDKLERHLAGKGA